MCLDELLDIELQVLGKQIRELFVLTIPIGT